MGLDLVRFAIGHYWAPCVSAVLARPNPAFFLRACLCVWDLILGLKSAKCWILVPVKFGPMSVCGVLSGFRNHVGVNM